MYAPSAIVARGYTRKFRFLPGAPGYVTVSVKRIIYVFNQHAHPIVSVDGTHRLLSFFVLISVSDNKFVSPQPSRTLNILSNYSEMALSTQRKQALTVSNVNNAAPPILYFTNNIPFSFLISDSTRRLWLPHPPIPGLFFQSTYRLLRRLRCQSRSVRIGGIGGCCRCIWP